MIFCLIAVFGLLPGTAASNAPAECAFKAVPLAPTAVSVFGAQRRLITVVPVRYGEAARDYLLRYGQYLSTPQPEEFMGLNCVRHSEPVGLFPLLWCTSNDSTTRRGRYYPHKWPQNMGQRIMVFFDRLSPAPPGYLPPTYLR